MTAQALERIQSKIELFDDYDVFIILRTALVYRYR